MTRWLAVLQLPDTMDVHSCSNVPSQCRLLISRTLAVRLVPHLALMLRRFTAFLLMLCLASFSAEAQVADVHDGDATAAEMHLRAASHGVAHVAHAGAAHGSESDGGDGRPVHTQHVCHAAHAHGAVAATPYVSDAAGFSGASAPVARPVRMPPSLEPEPHLRPPIAA